MKRSFMPFYDGDFMRDTAHLSADEGWAYLHLIMYYWANGSLPTEPVRLARIAKMSLKRWRNRASTLADFFDSDWKHKRIEEELDKYEKFCEKQRSNAASGSAKRKPNGADWLSLNEARALGPEPEPLKEKNSEKEKSAKNGEEKPKRNLPFPPPRYPGQSRHRLRPGVLLVDGKLYRDD